MERVRLALPILDYLIYFKIEDPYTYFSLRWRRLRP